MGHFSVTVTVITMTIYNDLKVLLCLWEMVVSFSTHLGQNNRCSYREGFLNLLVKV